jgi:hypothetical protein
VPLLRRAQPGPISDIGPAPAFKLFEAIMTGPQPQAHIVWAKARSRRSPCDGVKLIALVPQATVNQRNGCSSRIAT